MEIVQRSKNTFCTFFSATFFLTFLYYSQTAKSEVEKIAQIESSPSQVKESCSQINMRDYKSASTSTLKPLSELIQDLTTGLKAYETKAILKLLHPKLNTKYNDLDKILQKMKFRLGILDNVTIFRLWKLSGITKDSLSQGISCDSETVVYPHYGYDSHYVLWLQAMGNKELGRLFVTLVNLEGEWKIGYFHFHQWSLGQKDFLGWIIDADKDLEKSQYESAYLKYDCAKKLLNSTPHFMINARRTIEKHLQEKIPNEFWLGRMKKSFPNENVVFASSMFVQGGLGLIVRFLLKKEISTKDIRDHCKKQLSTILAKPWFSSLEGIKCSYVVPGEDIKKEGYLGGLYLSKSSG